MGVIWNKIWYEFWRNKGRTIQVVAIVTIGAFAIGMIINTRNSVASGMQTLWEAGHPMSIGVMVDPPVDDDQVIALKHIDGVAELEGLLQETVEWRLSPDADWQQGTLNARNDYHDQKVATLALKTGQWPSGKTADVSQGVDTAYGILPGMEVEIRSDDRTHVLPVVGRVYDNYVQPPSFGGQAQFYVDRLEFEYITGRYDYNLIYGTLDHYSQERALRVANEMQNRLEAAGSDVYGATPPDGERYTNPSKHFFQDFLDAIFLVMGIMGFLAMVLGLFLVYNTISALVSQQVDQIGIMKAIGAKTPDILRIYMITVMLYGLVAMVVSVPLGVLAGNLLVNSLMGSFDAPPQPLQLWPAALLVQVAICLGAPIIASLIPVFSGARITVREAISTYGIGGTAGLMDRLLARFQSIPRILSLTLSNTFRHKGRVILTQITLVMSGLIFMMVIAVSDSVNYTFRDVVFSILNFNVTLEFVDPERIHKVEDLVLLHPDVESVEMWTFSGPKIRLAGQPESDDDKTAILMGLPLPTNLYGYQLRKGRWLSPEDTYAVVVNEKLAGDAGVTVGDWVTLDFGVKGESDWLVVGEVFDPIMTTVVLAPREPVLIELGQVDKASTLWVQTVRKDPAGEEEAAESLRQYLDANHYDLMTGSAFGPLGDTASGVASFIVGQFTFIIILLLVMAVVIGVVGSIALSGVLSLNIRERSREIGVMRAIGASSSVVSGTAIGEGLILGWLSWLIALPFSIPASMLMTSALSSMLGLTLLYHYTPRGGLIWFVAITVLSVAASWLPARRASNISVRESLAYQ